MTNPCIDCLTLSVCMNKGVMTNGTINLADNCNMLDAFIFVEGNFNIDRFLEAYHYFKDMMNGRNKK